MTLINRLKNWIKRSENAKTKEEYEKIMMEDPTKEPEKFNFDVQPKKKS